jgi:hypothetical protein
MKLRTVLPLAALSVFALMQLVRPEKTNPPVVTVLQWDSSQTQALARRACMDCHSNETTWPWYAQVAPVSWLLVRDVNEGRKEFNLSALGNLSANGANKLANEIDELVERGEMPLAIYLPTHPEARLNDDEKRQLTNGLRATLAKTVGAP